MLLFDGLFKPSAPITFGPRPSFSGINGAMLLAGGTLAEPTLGGGGDEDTRPELGYLMLLVFGAVMEVVCLSLPGYILARQGMFDTEMQKFVANLNITLFTPCLIFTKLASQLTLEKISELAIIPVLFVVMTLTSYCCALLVARMFGFHKRARNFIIAMGVFGNSNSLPISLVMSLSMTVGGLHWDRLPNDKDGDVAARGILYLLIFQQLGQLVRWSWGYHVLLAAPGKDDGQDGETPAVPVITGGRYRDVPEDEEESISDSDLEAQTGIDPFAQPQFENSFMGLHRPPPSEGGSTATDGQLKSDSRFQSGQTTNVHSVATSAYASRSQSPFDESSAASSITSRPSSSHLPSLPSVNGHQPSTLYGMKTRLPAPVARVLVPVAQVSCKFYNIFLGIMNPPLWAMLAAVIVASTPKLKQLFFTPGTFIENSVTRAVKQTGGVAVPLILVVLGANLAGQTADKKKGVVVTPPTPAQQRHDTKLLIASLLARMLLPYLVTAPLIALAAKYLPISILDDPIFVVVCFLLVGAPSALQLAQICQMNGVYEYVMARILFWSYVVIILPSTLVLVVTAIEVVKWAM